MKKVYIAFLMFVGTGAASCTFYTKIVHIEEAKNATDKTIIMGGSRFYKIYVKIYKRDAQYIVERQIYPHFKIYDCSNEQKVFPADLYLDSSRMDDFEHSESYIESRGSQNYLTISAYAPVEFIDNIKNECAQLVGGSYLGYRIKSKKIEVE